MIATQIELPHPHNYWVEYCKHVHKGPITDEAQQRAFHAGMEAAFKFLDHIMNRDDLTEDAYINGIRGFRKLNELHATKQL